MRFDLHVHSNASDGSFAPHELVRLALDRGLSTIAIADHDSVDGVAAARHAAANTTLRVIPAVELSAVHDGRDVHILGYFVDVTDPVLAAVLVSLRRARIARAESMVAALRAAGYDVSLDDVLLMSSEGSVGRSHVARALVGRGHAASVADAFERFIGRGRPFYVAKPVSTPESVIATVHAAGGVSVLAHPGITGVDDIIEPLVAAGLDGIEAYHAEHSSEQRKHYDDLAASLGILVTGGSDYHGPGAPGAELGSVDIPARALAALLAAGG